MPDAIQSNRRTSGRFLSATPRWSRIGKSLLNAGVVLSQEITAMKRAARAMLVTGASGKAGPAVARAGEGALGVSANLSTAPAVQRPGRSNIFADTSLRLQSRLNMMRGPQRVLRGIRLVFRPALQTARITSSGDTRATSSGDGRIVHQYN
ncbi:MAG: hypothetical protein KIT44_15930 [Opitutaceae bacterium]|nr:hypothetical protein [Opitutaceae bacterium]